MGLLLKQYYWRLHIRCVRVQSVESTCKCTKGLASRHLMKHKSLVTVICCTFGACKSIVVCFTFRFQLSQLSLLSVNAAQLQLWTDSPWLHCFTVHCDGNRWWINISCIYKLYLSLLQWCRVFNKRTSRWMFSFILFIYITALTRNGHKMTNACFL